MSEIDTADVGQVVSLKRRFVTSICAALLVWAALDDVLAAQTPEADDDVAAAQDNDCLQCAPVKVPARTEARLVYSVPLAADIGAAPSPAATAGSVGGSCPLCDPLYLFMSLQR
jgi:hypothetical protein